MLRVGTNALQGVLLNVDAEESENSRSNLSQLHC
jgi:hypothetical protein